MKRLPFRSFLACAASIAAFGTTVACGGISDPTKATENVATISGALTGTNVPAGARVALVWKVGTTSTYAVRGDVAVVGGQFTMDLSAPPQSYFFEPEGEGYAQVSAGGSGDTTETTPLEEPDTGGSSGAGGGSAGTPGSGAGASFAFASGLAPRDTVSGGFTQPLQVAMAGFIVYLDTNGNGKLDVDPTSLTSTDQIIGGNREIMLAYLRDGGALDYEKLRDRSGIAPTAGYNLMWEEGRWLPLNVVELKLSASSRLPSSVCGGFYADEGPRMATPMPSGGSGSGGSLPTPAPEPMSAYPDPNDPNLVCSDDGYSFSYTYPSVPCEEPTPTPQGLCSGGYGEEDAPSIGCATGGGYGDSIEPGSTPPDGWPCPIEDAMDGGTPDGGPADAGVKDAGSAPDAG